MSDEQAAMDQVGRYWDAVAGGDRAPGYALDPALARTIQRVHGLAATPSAEARERVWQTVLANSEALRRQEEGSMLRVLVPNGRAPDAPVVGIPEGAPDPRQRWFMAQLATAALIVLTLAGSFMVFGPGRFSRQEEPPVFIPAIVATPSTPEAAAAPIAEFLWSSEGGPELPLGDPYFLTLDPDGNLWVPDGLNSRFQIFSPNGDFLETWGEPGSGDGEFDFVADPYGVGAVDFDIGGNLYVADHGNGRIQKFGSDRAFLMAWDGSESVEGRLTAPLDIAIGNDGNVYVSDVDDDYVKVFDSDGRYLYRWGGLGASDGKFMEISGLGVDAAGSVWVVDAGEHRVQKFTADGAFVNALGGYGQQQGEFRDPSDVALDAEGRAYVADWENHRVQVFDGDGQFVAAWGEQGDGEGQFQGPASIVLDALGNAYVSDDGIDDVMKFRLLPPLAPGEDLLVQVAAPEAAAEEKPIAEFLWHADGSPELEFREPNHPAIDPEGNVWMPDGWNNRIAIFAPDGTWLEDWGTEGSGEGEFLFENGGIGFGGVAFDAAGNIYVADSGNHRVQKFGPDRSFITAWGRPGNGNGEFVQPVALTVDGQGRVYVSDRTDSVEVFDSNGQWLASWGDLSAPVGITTDRDGDVWVADEGLTQVIEFSPDGERLTTWDDYGSDDGQFSGPSGIDVDADGRIFVSDRAQRVQIFAPDGEFLGSWGRFGVDPGQINGPYGVVVGENGVAYIAEDYGQRLQAFRLLAPFGSGEAEAVATPVPSIGAIAEVVWETRGGPNLPLSYPGYLALDPAGNLWIPDSGNDRYQIFSPDGQFLEAWGETGSGDGQFEFEVDLFHSSAIAFAPDGSFYVTDPGNFRVQKFGPDRAFVAAWGEAGAGSGQFDLMNSIAVDGQGRVYVTDDGRSDVQVFDPDGVYLMTIGERGFNDGQFLFTTGSAVTIDSAGTIWVSDSSNQRIQTFSPDGKVLSKLAGGAGEDEIQQPNQLAIDGDGRIFVTATHLRQVQRFSADGTYLGAIGTANPTAWAEGEIPSGDFLVPTGVVLDGLGNLYVADYEDYRVQKFRLLLPMAAEEPV